MPKIAGHLVEERLIEAVGLETDKHPIMVRGPGRTLSRHAVMYIQKGHGYFEDLVTPRRPVSPGTVFYLHPNQWHNFDPSPGTVWTEYWVLFDGKMAEAKFGGLIPDKPHIFDIGMDGALAEAYETLHEACFSRLRGSAEYSAFLLHKILAELYLRINGIRFDDTNDTVRRAKIMMRKRVGASALDFKLFARSGNMTYDNFRKLFKRETGYSPKNYFLMLKINGAREALIRGTARVKQVAHDLGFRDPYYFSRLFKEKVGVSPNHYKRRQSG